GVFSRTSWPWFRRGRQPFSKRQLTLSHSKASAPAAAQRLWSAVASANCFRIRTCDERLQPVEPAVSALEAAALPSHSMDVADVAAAGIRLHVAGDRTPGDNAHPSMDEAHAAIA